MTVLLYPVQNREDDQPSPPEPSLAASGARGGSQIRRWLIFIVCEPFFQFIALGLMIWLGLAYIESLNQRYVIHVGPAQRQRLAIAYQQQFGQPPTVEQLRQLVDRDITDEIFLREGLALNLDKDDEIVRRRIAQKFEFLQTDLAVPPEPDPGVLARWFQRNQLRYITPPRVAFTQVYFSADRDGDDAAQARANRVLLQLLNHRTRRAPAAGDSFPGPTDIGALTPDAAERLFGKSELSEKLFTAPVGQWFGPVRSGYGWHLICLTEKKPPELPRLDDIRSRVLADYMEEQRQVLNAQAVEKLRAKYKVVHDGDAP
ncbi:MAG: peptidyl-prolyl cis-trans isomerase [Rhodospirillaceae bacterium]|nr:MAG: peptidyl-prolyl cis-trans isomerase [Rhodospirillaceae bacterium]